MGEEIVTQQDVLERLARLARAGGFDVSAYEFVMRGLDFTIARLGEVRHVSGAELVDGMVDFAKDQFGPFAHHVLNQWGVHTTRDFGTIVFHLVDEGILRKTAQDRIEDFDGRYDLAQKLEREYYRDHPVVSG